MNTMTKSELGHTDAGRGFARIIRGARYAVVTWDKTSSGNLYHVRSTHRSESVATEFARKVAKATGRVAVVAITD